MGGGNDGARGGEDGQTLGANACELLKTQLTPSQRKEEKRQAAKYAARQKKEQAAAVAAGKTLDAIRLKASDVALPTGKSRTGKANGPGGGFDYRIKKATVTATSLHDVAKVGLASGAQDAHRRGVAPAATGDATAAGGVATAGDGRPMTPAERLHASSSERLVAAQSATARNKREKALAAKAAQRQTRIEAEAAVSPELLLLQKKELLRLKKLAVRALRGEARALSIDEEAITTAIESENAKADLIKLVFKNTTWPETEPVAAPEPEPEPEPQPEPEPAAAVEPEPEPESEPRAGGASEAEAASAEIQQMVDALREQAEQLAQSQGWNGIFSSFEAVSVLTQVVAGTNYFLQVKTDEQEGCAHLRIFKPLPHTGAPPQVVAVRPGLSKADELKYFEVEG